MSNATKKQMKEIMGGVGILQDMKKMFEEYSKKIKKNKKNITKESKERKGDLKEFKENYVSRFKRLDKKTLKLWSKVSDLHLCINKLSKELNNKIQAVENQIAGLHENLTEEFKSKIKKIKKCIDKQYDDMKADIIIEVNLKIEQQMNKNNKELIKFQWVIVSLVLAIIVGACVKFVVDWLTP